MGLERLGGVTGERLLASPAYTYDIYQNKLIVVCAGFGRAESLADSGEGGIGVRFEVITNAQAS